MEGIGLQISIVYYYILFLYFMLSCVLSFINVSIKFKILIQVKICKFWLNIFF